MTVEIERKFLFRGNAFDAVDLGTKYSNNMVTIKDYYINEYTRVRYTYDYHYSEPICSMCAKSDGTKVRDEYEYRLAIIPNKFDFKCKPLTKKRYYVFHEGLHYEINVYKDIDLVLVELEGDYSDSFLSICKLPKWLGEEVTEDKNYYNYNLWKKVNSKKGDK